MRELIDSIGGSATEIVIVLAMAGAIVGLVTYIIRRVVRRLDIMTLQVDELRSARARAESERAHDDYRWEVARERERELIDILDLKFGVLVGRQGEIERRHGEIERRHGEMQRQHEAIQHQYSEMRRDMEELREGLREIRARIGEED